MSFNILQPLNRVQLPGNAKITCLYAQNKKYFIGFSNGDLTIMSMSTQQEPIKPEQRSIRSLRSLSEIKRLFLDNELSQLLVPEKTFKNVTGNQAPIVSLDALPLYPDQNREILVIGQPDFLQVFEWVGPHLNLVFSFDEVKSYNKFSYIELEAPSGLISADHEASTQNFAKTKKNEAKESLQSSTKIFLIGSQKKLLIYEIVRKSRNIFDFVFRKDLMLKSRLKDIACFPERSLAVLALSSGFLNLDLRNGFQLSDLNSEQSNNFSQNSSFSYFGLSSSSPEVSIIPFTNEISLVVRDSEVGRLEFQDNGLYFHSDSGITLSACPIKTAFLHPNYLLVIYAKTFDIIEITSGQLVQTFKYQSKVSNTLLSLSGSVVTIVAGNTVLQFSYLSYQKQLSQFLSARGEISTNGKDVSNDLHLFGLERAISLLSLLDENDDFFTNDLDSQSSPLKTKNLHLRDLYKEKALVYFETYSRYHEALVDIASDWIITYTEILHLFPDFLNGNIQIHHEISQDKPSRANSLKTITLDELKRYMGSEANRGEATTKAADAFTNKMEDFIKAVNNLIIYLTDQRRIHLSLLNSKDDNPYIMWKSVKIDAADLYPGVDKMKLKSRLEISACAIDTTLFLCYFYVKPLMLGPLLRLPNNKCDAGIVNKCILENVGISSTQSSSYMTQLLDFYFGRSLHEDAMEMLFNLSHGNPMPLQDGNKSLQGPWLAIRYLQKLSNDYLDLILRYSKNIMRDHPDLADNIAQAVFMTDTYECESYDNYKVLEFFENSIQKPELARSYLEWLLQESDILEHSSRSKDREMLGTKLCLLYMDVLKGHASVGDDIMQVKAYAKLQAILESGRDFVPWTVLKAFPPGEDKFLRLTIFVYRRLGEHSKSVDILYNQLGDFDSAMHYCAEIYKEPNGKKTGQDLLHKLLEDLLMHYEENVDFVAKLLASEGSKMSPFFVLTALPKSFPLHKIAEYLEFSIQFSEEQVDSTRFKGQLYKTGTTKLRHKILLTESKSFLVSSEKEICRVCGHKYGHQVLCVSPLNHVVHYGCYQAEA